MLTTGWARNSLVGLPCLKRNLHKTGDAFSFRGFYPDVPTMSLDNFFTHRETKPPSFTKRGFSIRRKMLLLFLRQCRSIVMNLENGIGIFCAYADGNHGIFL